MLQVKRSKAGKTFQINDVVFDNGVEYTITGLFEGEDTAELTPTQLGERAYKSLENLSVSRPDKAEKLVVSTTTSVTKPRSHSKKTKITHLEPGTHELSIANPVQVEKRSGVPLSSESIEPPRVQRVLANGSEDGEDLAPLAQDITKMMRSLDLLPSTIETALKSVLIQRDKQLIELATIHEEIEQLNADINRGLGRSGLQAFTFDGSSTHVLKSFRQMKRAQSEYNASNMDQVRTANALRAKSEERTERLQEQIASLKELNEQHKHKIAINNDEQSVLKQQLIQSQQEHQSLRDQQRASQQQHLEDIANGLVEFWAKREEFYRELHRGILFEKDKKSDSLKTFRRKSLEADIDLLRRLGCTVTLSTEAIAYARQAYDGSDHQWHYEEEHPVPNGQDATVFLPGWKIGETRIKPSMGSQEVTQQ